LRTKISTLSFCIAISLLLGCKKNTTSPLTTTTVSAGKVLSSEATVVLVPTYITLASGAASMYNGAVQFQTSPTQQNLANCRQLWLTASADYEVSAASLFGPGGSLGADPASIINTYPIDTAGINSLINSSAVFTLSYIDSLPSYLTGFHGMEFELYGINGNKTAAEFTPQQLSYISAVALCIDSNAVQISRNWISNYTYQFVNAGAGSTVYPSQYAAFSDLIMGIANICETDGIYKLNGILANKSVILQESPFANNSINDIENNLLGVKEIYYGQYNGVNGTGLTTYVSQNTVSLDLKIKTDINSAISAVGAITEPLPQAIYNQVPQMTAALNACDSLDDDLKVGLLTYFNSKLN
jgi:putative iron-regulated protein